MCQIPNPRICLQNAGGQIGAVPLADRTSELLRCQLGARSCPTGRGDIGALALPARSSELSRWQRGARSCPAGRGDIGALALPAWGSELPPWQIGHRSSYAASSELGAVPLPGRSEKGTASSKSRYGTLSQNGYGDNSATSCSGYPVSCHHISLISLALSPKSRPIPQPEGVAPRLRWLFRLPHSAQRSPTRRRVRNRVRGHTSRLQPSSVLPSEKASSTRRASQAVPHPSTDRALQRLTSEFGRDPVYSLRYGR